VGKSQRSGCEQATASQQQHTKHTGGCSMEARCRASRTFYKKSAASQITQGLQPMKFPSAFSQKQPFKQGFASV
jgi:hypothetical protein